MAMEDRPGLSPTSKRLLGIRDFDALTPDRSIQLFKSEQRRSAVAAIDTTTLPRGPQREMKRGIVAEFVERGLVPEELLRTHESVYLGSGTDIEYPLALGARVIVMVDPILKEQAAVDEVIERVTKLTNAAPERTASGLTFSFDFGSGAEKVNTVFVPEPYTPDTLPDNAAMVVLFASQGPGGRLSAADVPRSKLALGGAILEEANVFIHDPNEERQMQLGRN